MVSHNSYPGCIIRFLTNRKTVFILVSFAILPLRLNAQTNDFGIWTSIGLEKKFGKWNVESAGEFRTKDNAQQMDRLSLQLEGTYNFIKYVSAGLGYEYIDFHDTRYLDYQPRHRAYSFIQGKYKWGRFTFSLRERVQVTKKDDSDRVKKSGEINTYKIDPSWIYRNRIKLAFNIAKIPVDPSVSVETFYQLNNPDGNNWCKFRYTLALNYNVTKHHHLELYELLDKEVNVNNPVNSYVTGIKYSYSF